MKINFFLCGVVMLSAGSAFGIRTPSENEIKDIQNQMFAANRMDNQVGAANQKVLDAKKTKKSEASILELERQVAREKEKQNAARTKAIHMAIAAYGLEPVRKS